MKVSALYPTKYLSADDLQGREFTLTVSHLTVEEMNDGKHKPIIYFQETQKGLVLNKTNSNNISVVYGDETDHWVGRQITLFGVYVDFQGQSKLAIRVRPASAAPTNPALHPDQPLQAGGTPLGQPPAAPSTVAGAAPLDDEIPF